MPFNLMTIAPSNIRDYARAKGWALLPEAILDRLYVLQNPLVNHGQLAFPMDTTAPDYEEAVRLVAEKLAYFEGRSLEFIFSNLLTVRDDTLRLRIATDREGIESLPLTFATIAIDATKDLLSSAAHTVLRPQPHHPRLNRAEAQRFLDVAQFQHTEHTSFVLKVSCAIDALDVQIGERREESPFVRQTMLTVSHGIRQLVTAIETDQLTGLVEEITHEQIPLVSSNLCEALTHFQDDTLRNSLEVSVSWAPVRPVAEIEAQPIRIPRDYFPRIEEVRRALRDTERHVEGTFIGTVEQLNGDPEDDGRRAGEITLDLLVDGKIVHAKTSLDADQYEKADFAHMNDNVFVIITGTLRPGNQPRQLTNITGFELINALRNHVDEQA